MSNEIVLLVKRNYVELFYCQNNTEFRHYKQDGETQIPLCFLSDGNIFEVGSKAKVQFEIKNRDAYSDYFELIKKVDEEFKFIGGVKQPVKNLIVRGAEFLINNFLKNVLYSSESVYELKNKLKFNLIFHNDINENEINFVSELFVEEGFSHTKSFFSNYLVLNYLDINRKIGRFKGYITVDAINNNLNLSFYDSLSKNQAKIFDTGKNLATRPEINVIANELCQKAIEQAGSLTNLENEIPLMLETAEKALSDLEKRAEIRVNVNLSDGSPTESVKLKRSSINQKTSVMSEFSQDLNFLHRFIKKTHLQQTDFIIVLNKNVKNQTFIDKVRSTFPNDSSVDVEFFEILELFNNNTEIIARGNLIKSKTTASKKTKSTESIKSNTKNSTFAPPPPPPPPPPPMTSTRTRDRSKTKSTVNIPKGSAKVSGSVPQPPPPPPPPPMTNTKTRSRSKISATEASKSVKKKSSPPPLPSAKKKSSPPPLPSAKKKSSPPPLPSAKKKSSPPPLPSAKKKSGPPPLPKKK